MATIVTPDFIQSLWVTLDYRFQQAMTQAESFYDKISTEVPSGSRANHYPLMDRMPGQLRKWVGERVKQGGAMFDYMIVNDKYEGTVSIEREDIEDSQLALAQMTVDSIGYQTKVWPDRLVTAVLEAGEVNATYDQVPFFSGSHPLNAALAGGAVQANLFNTATTGSTKIFNAVNYKYVLQAWRSLKGADGLPMGMGRRPTLMVPTAIEWDARTVLNSELIATSAVLAGNSANAPVTNIFKNSADLLVNPWLTSPTAWYLLDVGMPIKPLLFQRRTQPEFTWLNQPTDRNVFWQDQYDYGVRVRGNAGYGLWFMACKADT